MRQRSYLLHTVVAMLLLAPASAVQAQTAKVKGPDYSLKGGEYSVLNNLMMYGVDSIEYVGTEQTEAYGVKYTAAKFRVQAGVHVSGYGKDMCPDEGRCDRGAKVEFEVLVGPDASGKIHDRMLKRIHDYWAANNPRKWSKVDAAEHLNYKDGKYVMFEALHGRFLGPRAKRLVWVEGKVIKFNFKRFLYGDNNRYNEDEALENFVGGGIRLRVGGVDIQLRQMKGSFSKEFFKLYNEGAFRVAS